jgi:transcriptional regulator with XRE-family HTH domain
MAPVLYGKILSRNIAAARTRLDIDQEEVASRMRKLGYAAWIRQTVSATERGRRRPTAEEIPGLAIALATTVARLLQPEDGQEVQLQVDGPVLPPDYVRDAVFAKSSGGAIAWEEDKLTIAASPMPPEMLGIAERLAREGWPKPGERIS